MHTPKVSLEQWRMLQAVVDYGGYAQAAKALHKSQSSISYAVARLEELLGITVLEIKGRKAYLTASGRILLDRSRQLVHDAGNLEQIAHNLEKGWEAEIQLVVEPAYPSKLLMRVLQEFAHINRQTRIQLKEAVLSGAAESLLAGKADIAITPFIPHGYLSEPLLEVRFIAIAQPQHPLHLLQRQLTANDITRETQVIVSDSGSKSVDAGWLSDTNRWSTSSFTTSKELIRNGLGFGWLPYDHIEEDLNQGKLKPLPLETGSSNSVIFYLIYGKQELAGPATKQLGELFKSLSQSHNS